jgi:hypothetical protein
MQVSRHDLQAEREVNRVKVESLYQRLFWNASSSVEGDDLEDRYMKAWSMLVATDLSVLMALVVDKLGDLEQ